jgi:hypothetical protein
MYPFKPMHFGGQAMTSLSSSGIKVLSKQFTISMTDTIHLQEAAIARANFRVAAPAVGE